MNNNEIVKFIEDAEAEGANVYVDKNTGIATSEFYRTEITRLDFDINIDFHKLEGKSYNETTRKWDVDESKTVYSPKVSVLDRIADCAGVTFVKNETNEVMHNDEYGKHTAFIANCIGRKMMSDGNYKDSSLQIYEFDPLIQAMSEGGEDSKLRRKTLDYRKNAAKRAETGARLRVIRELVGLPQGFPKERAEKYFVIGRTVPNLKEIASTERGRALAECKALGIDPALLLYGARQNQRFLPEHDTAVDLAGDQKAEPSAESPTEKTPGDTVNTTAALAAAADEPDFPDEPTGPGSPPQEETEFMRLSHTLDQIMTSYKAELDKTSQNGRNPYRLAEEELNNSAATEETRRSMVGRLITYLKKKGINV